MEIDQPHNPIEPEDEDNDKKRFSKDAALPSENEAQGSDTRESEETENAGSESGVYDLPGGDEDMPDDTSKQEIETPDTDNNKQTRQRHHTRGGSYPKNISIDIPSTIKEQTQKELERQRQFRELRAEYDEFSSGYDLSKIETLLHSVDEIAEARLNRSISKLKLEELNREAETLNRVLNLTLTTLEYDARKRGVPESFINKVRILVFPPPEPPVNQTLENRRKGMEKARRRRWLTQQAHEAQRERNEEINQQRWAKPREHEAQREVGRRVGQQYGRGETAKQNFTDETRAQGRQKRWEDPNARAEQSRKAKAAWDRRREEKKKTEKQESSQ